MNVTATYIFQGRRRKVACKYASETDTVCVNCQGRSAPCVSQEYDPEEAVPPSAKPSSDVLADRLDRLEEMMSRLSKGDKPPQPFVYDPCRKDTDLDLLDQSAVKNAQEITGGAGLHTPEASAHSPTDVTSSSFSVRATRYRKSSLELHALLPSKELRQILAYESPGAIVALQGFHTHAEVLNGKTETISSLADEDYPQTTCHPAVLAKRLLQYTICLQLLPQSRLATLDLGGRIPCQVLSSWVSAASDLVTSVDDLVGSLEGLECLILQVWFHGDAGHLRKAWMAGRRALGMAQLMGLGRPTPSVRSVSSRFPANPNVLWYKINCCDRYQSLILGLPAGSHNNSFAHERFMKEDNSLDKMSKQYAVLAGRISERQDIFELSSQESYAVTQSIDADMETASRTVPVHWWATPDVNTNADSKSSDQLMSKHTALRIQVRHYTLMILLHLPFIVRESESQLRRYDYNRKTCLHAARCVLQRFLVFRRDYLVYVAGRHVDYAALIASMTLCLGYLGAAPEVGRESDTNLLEETLGKFKLLAAQKGDKLSQESFETIHQMLGILKGNMNQAGVALAVPFLGTVNIGQKTLSPEPNAPYATTGTSQSAFMGSDTAAIEGFQGNFGGEFDFNFAPLSLSFDTGTPSHQDSVTGTLTGHSGGDISWSPSHWFDMSTDPDDWALQGVDTSFWSTLNQSMN